MHPGCIAIRKGKILDYVPSPVKHFSTDRSLYFANGTRYGHSYNERPLTADSFAVSCIGLGWVNIFRSAMGWVGFDGSTAISA